MFNIFNDFCYQIKTVKGSLGKCQKCHTYTMSHNFSLKSKKLFNSSSHLSMQACKHNHFVVNINNISCCVVSSEYSVVCQFTFILNTVTNYIFKSQLYQNCHSFV